MPVALAHTLQILISSPNNPTLHCSLNYSHSSEGGTFVRTTPFRFRFSKKKNGFEIFHRSPPGLSLPHTELAVRRLQARTGFTCSAGRRDRRLRLGPLRRRLRRSLRRSGSQEQLRFLPSGSSWSLIDHSHSFSFVHVALQLNAVVSIL